MGIKEINQFFRTIIKSEYEEICEEILLSEEEQDIFHLKYIDKKGNSEIARIVGKTPFYINNRLVNIRKKLIKLPIFNKSSFSCDTATEYQIKEKCRKLGKSKEYADFCIDAFVIKLTRKEMASKYMLEPNTIKQYKRIRRKELETS